MKIFDTTNGNNSFLEYNRNPIELAHFCLIDKKRSLAFRKAIFDTVSKGDVVADIGTGSGIMALFAAKAGARKIYAVEIHPYVTEFAMRNIELNRYQDKINVICADGRAVNLPKNLDVVIIEMVTSGLIDELLAPVLNSLYKKEIITENTKLIPYKVDTFVELVETDFDMYGFKVEIIKYEWPWYENSTREMSDSVIFSSLDLGRPFNEIADKKITFKIKKSGRVNGLRIKSIAHLTRKIKLGVSMAFCAPVVIPCPEREFREGERVDIRLRYKMGGGYESLIIEYD